MRNQMEPGAGVRTIGGMYAVVKEVNDETVLLEITDGVHAHFAKNAIAAVLAEEEFNRIVHGIEPEEPRARRRRPPTADEARGDRDADARRRTTPTEKSRREDRADREDAAAGRTAADGSTDTARPSKGPASAPLVAAPCAHRSQGGRTGRNKKVAAAKKGRRSSGSQGYPGRALAVILIVLVALTGGMFLSGHTTPRLGIDLAGGVSITLTAKPADQANAVNKANMNTAVSIIDQRVNGLGVSEAEVQTQGDGNIIVNIPKGTNADAGRAAGRHHRAAVLPARCSPTRAEHPAARRPPPAPARSARPALGDAVREHRDPSATAPPSRPVRRPPARRAAPSPTP